MGNVKQLFKNLVTDDSGQDLIEYALVAALVGLSSVSAISSLTGVITNTFNNISNTLATA